MERVWQHAYANHAEAMNERCSWLHQEFLQQQEATFKLGNLPPSAYEQQQATTLPIDVFEKTCPLQNPWA
jgi:hypothetical protein